MGLDQPAWVQYWRFTMTGVVSGDLGTSARPPARPEDFT